MGLWCASRSRWREDDLGETLGTLEYEIVGSYCGVYGCVIVSSKRGGFRASLGA